MKSITLKDDDLAHRLNIQILWDSVFNNESLKQPYVDYKGRCFILNSKLHEWFISSNIEYSLSFIDVYSKYSTISFKKDSDAVLFKLTWM